MAGVWSKIGGWLRGGDKPAKGKTKAAKGKVTGKSAGQRPGNPRTAAANSAQGPQSPAEARAARQRLIDEAMRIRAEKMEGFKDMDPETRARIEKAALGKLNPKKQDAPEDD